MGCLMIIAITIGFLIHPVLGFLILCGVMMIYG